MKDINNHWTKQDKTPTSANIPDNWSELSEQDLNAVSGGSGLRLGHGPVVNAPGESEELSQAFINIFQHRGQGGKGT